MNLSVLNYFLCKGTKLFCRSSHFQIHMLVWSRDVTIIDWQEKSHNMIEGQISQPIN